MRKYFVRTLAIVFIGTMFSIGGEPANATTIDFEVLAAPGTGVIDSGTTYTEDGFTISASALWSVQLDHDWFAGSTGMFLNDLGLITLEKNTSAAFSLASIDLSELAVGFGGPFNIGFTGNISGGGTITQTFALNGAFGFENFQFTGFDNVTSVTWNQTLPGVHQFDNIEVGAAVPAAVPEPASLVLFGSGLLGLMGWAARRRKTAI